MKVLLVKPFGITDEIIPPVSLGLLATHIRKYHSVKILDALKEGLNGAAVAKMVKSEDIDVVGFQIWTKDIHNVREISNIIKSLRPDTKIIVGGIHPTVLPEGTMRFFGKSIDFAYQGEGEIGFKMFLDAIESGEGPVAMKKVPGLVWKDGHDIKVNNNKLNENLDSLGFPAWDLIPPSTYPKAPHGAFYRNFPIAPIIITRGCPFPCTYCSASILSDGKLRSRSVEHVIEELKMLYHKFGVREFQIEDDNFTLNRKYVYQFCERLLSENLNLTWSFPNGVRLDTIDRKLLKLMKRAGCYALNFGIESGSQRILNMIKKKLTLDQIAEQLTLVHEEGYEIGGFFILGFPTETREEIEDTIRFACTLPLDRIAVSYFQPFPKTHLYQELIEKGEINEDWVNQQSLSLQGISYVPQTITAIELRQFRTKMLKRFYFRVRPFLKMLSQFRSPSHSYYIIKRSIRWLKA